MIDAESLTHPFASTGSFLIWLAAVSVAVATIWKTWLGRVARRMRIAFEAIIELRDLMKTELHLPGDGTSNTPRTSLREDLQALTSILADAVESLARCVAQFEHHDRRLDEHDRRLDDHHQRIAIIETRERTP